MTAPQYDQADVAAMMIILSNVVARLVLLETKHPEERRAFLCSMSDTCKLAVERSSSAIGGEREPVLRRIDEFFKGITIT